MNHKGKFKIENLKFIIDEKYIFLIIGILIVFGVGWTIKDYREWRRLETQNYGQGWKDLRAEARPLTREYRNDELGITADLPDGLKIGDQINFGPGNESDSGVKKRTEEEPGGRVFVIERMGKSVGGKMVVLEARMGEEEWGKWEKTVQAIFESIREI